MELQLTSLIPASAGSWGLQTPDGSYPADKPCYLLLMSLCLYAEVLSGASKAYQAFAN